jgi:hypothetical protein
MCVVLYEAIFPQRQRAVEQTNWFHKQDQLSFPHSFAMRRIASAPQWHPRKEVEWEELACYIDDTAAAVLWKENICTWAELVRRHFAGEGASAALGFFYFTVSWGFSCFDFPAYVRTRRKIIHVSSWRMHAVSECMCVLCEKMNARVCVATSRRWVHGLVSASCCVNNARAANNTGGGWNYRVSVAYRLKMRVVCCCGNLVDLSGGKECFFVFHYFVLFHA